MTTLSSRTIGRFLLAFCALGLMAATAGGQTATIEQKLAKLAELRKQKADIEKAEAALVAEIRVLFKDLTDRLSELGIGPGPMPPAPPKPDELRDKLTTAFKADKGTKDEAKKLASIYAEASKLVVKKNVAGDFAIVSSAQLIAAVRDVTNDPDWIGPDALRATRDAIAELWVPIFGPEPSDARLTDEQRKAAADLFGRLAVVLEVL